MAQQFNPWLSPLMQQPQSPEDILKLAMNGIAPNPQIQEMAAQGAPKPAPQQIPKIDPAEVALQPGETSRSMSVKQFMVNPTIAEEAAKLRQQYEGMRGERMAEEQAGIDRYAKDVSDYEAKPTGIDWRGLAALVDRFGDGSTYKVAEAMKPETKEEKQMKLMAMKDKLQSMKGNLTKSQFDAIKDQLDSYKAEMNAETAEKRLQASMTSKDNSQNRLRSRDDDKDLMEFQKRVQPFQKVDNTVSELEKTLGFNLGDFDSSTNSVNGEKVDVPGVNLPMLGRLNQATPEGRRFKASLNRLLNTVLKERSGAAVTESEEQRLLSEFANGRYKFNTEADLLSTLRAYQDLLSADKSDVMAGFRPEVVEDYYNRSGMAKDYKRSGGVKPKAPAQRKKSLEEMTDEELDAYEKSLGG